MFTSDLRCEQRFLGWNQPTAETGFIPVCIVVAPDTLMMVSQIKSKMEESKMVRMIMFIAEFIGAIVEYNREQEYEINGERD